MRVTAVGNDIHFFKEKISTILDSSFLHFWALEYTSSECPQCQGISTQVLALSLSKTNMSTCWGKFIVTINTVTLLLNAKKIYAKIYTNESFWVNRLLVFCCSQNPMVVLYLIQNKKYFRTEIFSLPTPAKMSLLGVF